MRVSAVRGSVLSSAATIALVNDEPRLRDEPTDPFLGQRDAITAGRVICAG